MKNLIIGLIVIAIFALFFVWLPTPETKNASTQSIAESSQEKSISSVPELNFVIADVRLFDGEKILPHLYVLVRDGNIVSMADQPFVQNKTNPIPVIDGRGKTLLPGLTDAHTHNWGDALKQAIEFGVTTHIDMFSDPSWLQQQKETPELQAAIFGSGILATAPKGHGTEYGMSIPTLETAKDAQAFVDARISEGSDFIKIVYEAPGSAYNDFPSISKQTLTALISAAHLRGKKAVVHAQHLQSAKDALQAGADGLVHVMMDKLVDDEFLQLAKSHRAFVIPTLSVYSSLMPKEARQTFTEKLIEDAGGKSKIGSVMVAALESSFSLSPDKTAIKEMLWKTVLENTRRIYQAGIPILAGTDAPNPGTSYGLSLHGELRLLKQAGLTHLDILKAATVNIEKAFEIGGLGRLHQYAPATMMLVDGNPLADIAKSIAITHIWKEGKAIEQPRPSDNKTPALPSRKQQIAFDQLSDSDLQRLGVFATSDQQMGGQSSARLTIASEATSDSWLEISGEIKPGFVAPWAGMIVILGEDFSHPVDVSPYKQLHFHLRCNQPQITLMFFNQGNPRPLMHPIDCQAKWTQQVIRLEDISGLNQQELAAISLSAKAGNAGSTVPFRIELKSIRWH